MTTTSFSESEKHYFQKKIQALQSEREFSRQITMCISRFCNLTFVNFQFSRQITNEDTTEQGGQR